MRVGKLRLQEITAALDTLNAYSITVQCEGKYLRCPPKTIFFSKFSWERMERIDGSFAYTVRGEVHFAEPGMKDIYPSSIWPDWLEFELVKMTQ